MFQAGEKTCHSEPVTDVTGVESRSSLHPFTSPCETFLRLFTKIYTRKLYKTHISGLFFSVTPWYTDIVMKLSGKPDIAPRSRVVIAKPVRRLVVAIRFPRLGKTDSHASVNTGSE